MLFLSIAISNNYIASYNKSPEIISKTYSDVMRERYSILKSKGCNLVSKESSRNCNWEAGSQILFVGNSHHVDGFNAFYSILGRDDSYNLIDTGSKYWCAYIFKHNEPVVSRNGKCDYSASKLTSPDFLRMIDVLVVNIFQVTSWDTSFLVLYDKMRRVNPDLKIIVIGGFIGVRPDNCRELVNKTGNLDVCKNREYVSYYGANEISWLNKQKFTQNDFLYIDRVVLLCGKDKLLENCRTRVGKDLFFYDGDHFSLFGAKYLGGLIESEYRYELKELGIRY